jgi:hypothetical protein
MPSSARCRRQRTRPPTTAHTKIRRHTACLESHQISATSAPLNTRARRAKARVACAASLLRWIYSMVVHGTSWDAAVASGAAASQHAPRCQPEAA